MGARRARRAVQMQEAAAEMEMDKEMEMEKLGKHWQVMRRQCSVSVCK